MNNTNSSNNIKDNFNNLEFNISQEIQCHNTALRSFSQINDILVTGSFDYSCNIYKQLFHDSINTNTNINNISKSYTYELFNTTKFHTSFVFKVFPLKDKKCFLSSSKDKSIMMMDLEGNPLKQFLGHEGPVNSISQYDSKTFISGSWDGTARLWDLESTSCISILPNHFNAVTVCAFPNSMYITGSQDKRLRFWIKDHNTKNVDDAHKDIIRDITPNSDYTKFYTCSNDETIKLWNLIGQHLLTLPSTHDGYVFRVISIGDYIFSGGDDKVVKVFYNHKFIQDIFHPNSVWDMLVNEQGDLLTACGDGYLRIFSKNPDYWKTKEEIEAYNNNCLSVNTENYEKEIQDKNKIDVNTLPNIDYIYKNKGVEGQMKPFNNNGKGEVWSYEKGKWSKVGDVIGSYDSKSSNRNTGKCNSTFNARYYPGDDQFEQGEYDYVFDVEFNGNMTKIPFNADGNKLVTAQKFIKREKLHYRYQDEIVDFLKKNTTQKSIKSNNNLQENKGVGHFEMNTLNLVKLPIISYINYNSINTEGPLKKIKEYNLANNAFKEQEIRLIESIFKKVKETQFYHTSKFTDQEKDILLILLNKLGNEAYIYDTFRMIALHPNTSDLFKSNILVLLVSLCIKEGLSSNVDNVKIISMRVLINLFNNDNCRLYLNSKREDILNAVSLNLDTKNKNLKNAVCSILHNFSILFYNKSDNDAIIQIISLISECLSSFEDLDVVYLNNLLLGLANIIHYSKDNLNLAKDLDIVCVINELKSFDNEINKEIKNFLTITLK